MTKNWEGTGSVNDAIRESLVSTPKEVGFAGSGLSEESFREAGDSDGRPETGSSETGLPEANAIAALIR